MSHAVEVLQGDCHIDFGESVREDQGLEIQAGMWWGSESQMGQPDLSSKRRLAAQDRAVRAQDQPIRTLSLRPLLSPLAGIQLAPSTSAAFEATTQCDGCGSPPREGAARFCEENMLRQLEEFLGAHGARHERIDHREAFTSQGRGGGRSRLRLVLGEGGDRQGARGASHGRAPRMLHHRHGPAQGPDRSRRDRASERRREILKTFPGCELGAIPPFGRLFRVPTLVEEALVDQREITVPVGDHRTAIRMRAADYLRLAEPHLGQFAVHEETFPVHPGPRARRGEPAR